MYVYITITLIYRIVESAVGKVCSIAPLMLESIARCMLSWLSGCTT